MRPVAVVGNIALDRIDGGPPRIGGAPYYAARSLRVVGRPARIVTKCADADRTTLVPRLAAMGVPVSWRASAHTAAYSMSYRGDERLMTVDKLGEPWGADETDGWLEKAVARAEWIQVGALYRGEFPPETLELLARRRHLLLDGQGIVRPAREGPLRLEGVHEPEVLRHVSVLKLAEDEAQALLGDVDEDSVGSLGVPEVLVTLGPRGSLLFEKGRLERIPARGIWDRDPTGAGDGFAAAYVVARSLGHSPATAARRATAVVATLLMSRRR